MTGCGPVGRRELPDLLLTFIKWCRNYFSREMFSSDIDFNFLTFICKLDGQECQSYVLFQERRRAAGGHVADPFVVNVNIVAVGCDAWLCHLETDDTSGEAALLLLLQDIAAGKVALLSFFD